MSKHLSLILLAIVAGAAAHASEISGFSPEGNVKAVRQVRASFSDQMVPFGDPRPMVDVFDVTCAEKGKARWADGRNWIYDFDRDLPAGVSCSFKLKTGLKTLKGDALVGKHEFSFSTGGPAVLTTNPWEGSQISEDQAFVLSLDADADPASVATSVFFTVDGLHERLPVRVVTGEERETILTAAFGKGKYAVRQKKKPNLVLMATRRFPPNSKVTLVWGRGVRSASGVASAVDQTKAYTTRDEFTASLNCERENADSGCLPIAPIRIQFSAEVPWAMAKALRLVDDQGHDWSPEPKPDLEPPNEGFVTSVKFIGPFPALARMKVTLPAELHDDSGRRLVNERMFPLPLTLADYPPLAKFAAEFGIIELKPEAVLPVTLRNLEPEVKSKFGLYQASRTGAPDTFDGHVYRVDEPTVRSFIAWMGRIKHQGEGDARGESIMSDARSEELKVSEIQLKKPNGAKAFEVVGIPIAKPGFYVVELESRILGTSLLGAPKSMFVSTGALVTNMAVHFKKGQDSSLAWVTTLDEARPVKDALVGVRDCNGRLVAKGRTDAQGLARLPGIGSLDESRVTCNSSATYTPFNSGFYVTAEKDDDFSLVHTGWNKGIEPWRFNLPADYTHRHDIYATVFDRTLLRAGETVHMKHFVRRHTSAGIVAPGKDSLPELVEIRHLGSGQKWELPLKWLPGGVATSTWTIPKAGKLGEYLVMLQKKDPKHPNAGADGEGEEGYGDSRWFNRDNASGSFRVEEFRVPLMKARIAPPARELVGVSKATVDLAVEYLAGGGAGGLAVQLRTEQTPLVLQSLGDFDGYTFVNGKAHVEDEAVNLATESTDDEQAAEGEDAPKPSKKDDRIHRQSLALDKAGTARVELDGLKAEGAPTEVELELEFRDPSGEIQTASSKMAVYPSRTLVGVKPASSYGVGKKDFKFYVAATDLKGQPTEGAEITTELFERKVYSHRKRLLGGFYSYENHVELKKLGASCSGKTDGHGLLVCEAEAPISGNIIIQASTKDSDGHESFANASSWVYDKEDWWFEQGDNDRIDILSERKRYEPGETARFQVRTPFREATALVTVEREGVIDAFTVEIKGNKPIIEVPIKPEYAPNAFVSVLAVRGRVGDPPPTALVDLGRPAYKLGISEINVGWRAHELKVKVAPERDVYRVRQKAKVRLHVETADGTRLKAGAEALVAAVDEGLLELRPNDSWKLLEAMMNRRSYEVETSTAQMQVIGKRHFGLKAVPHGGDGGRALTRELFDTLLLWTARVPLDADGNATVEIPLNDSLTSFRIVAVADAGSDRFGTGSASIRSTQDLMLLSGIAPLAREKDHLPIELTARNTTDAAMSVELSGKVSGLSDELKPLKLELAAGEAKVAHWEFDVPLGRDSLTYEIKAKASSGVTDKIRITQKVVPAVPIRTLQATLAQLDGELVTNVKRPTDALTDRGGVNVTLNSSILSGLTGAREYMTAYPYSCMEQRVSRAIALDDRAAWAFLTEDLPAYLDRDGLVKYYPSDLLDGSDVLTSYLLSIAQAAELPLPDRAKDKMLEALKRFATGKLQRASCMASAADLSIRKVAAIAALAVWGKAERGMLDGVELTPSLWPTSAVLDWLVILGRVSDIAGHDERVKEAMQAIRSRLDFQGTMMSFSTEDQLWWLMTSDDVNANRLILAILDDAAWKDDLPRVVRGSFNRQNYGHWLTTVANAWGVVAMRKFALKFEAQDVKGKTQASLGDASEELRWEKRPKGGVLKLAWPAGGSGDVKVKHSGSGKPWATIQSLAAVPLKEPLSTGYKITKTWTPVEQKHSGQYTRGDVLRVHLELEAQADRAWVVVSDPIPAGATVLGSGLGGDSKLLSKGEKREGWVWPVYEERSFEAFREYYEYVPKGKWTVEYTVRLNQSGRMNLPPTHVEAMYSPEMFGELPNGEVSVAEE